ncbi:MAG: TetR family transcriptional regulator [Streptosporangiales bacterium]|nr:TetR family transcriptional regulator [Streptosporangiales bacterium]
MPRNRSDIDREDKLDEILNAAEDILRADGYASLTHSAVARALGLARTAICWYFPTRDDLFVATVERIFTATFAKAPAARSYQRRIEWGMDRLAELQPLILVLHERAGHSDAAARLEAAIQIQLCDRLRDVLRPHVEPARLDRVATTVVVFIEGLLAHRTPAVERRRMLRFLVAELVP